MADTGGLQTQTQAACLYDDAGAYCYTHQAYMNDQGGCPPVVARVLAQTQAQVPCPICQRTFGPRGLQGHISAAHRARGVMTRDQYLARLAATLADQR